MKNQPVIKAQQPSRSRKLSIWRGSATTWLARRRPYRRKSDEANLRVFLSNCLKSGVTNEEAPAARGVLHLIALSPGSVEIADGCVPRSQIDASLEEARSAPSRWTCVVMRTTRVAALALAAQHKTRVSLI